MNDFEVKAITSKYCDELLDQANFHLELYQNFPETFPLETKKEYYAAGSTMIFIKEEEFKNFKIEVNEDEKNKTANDLNNSRVIYNSLYYLDSEGKQQFLTPLQASDKRIWNFLSHHEKFWNYVNNRWGGVNPKIKGRFIQTSITTRALSQHALSRLWWFAELCFDKENSKDPLELLNVLCTNSDVLYAISEKTYFSNRKLLHATLKFLSKPENAELLKSENITEVTKVITAETGIRDLYMLSSSEIEVILTGLFKK